ncbi:MAG: helix-turn-helix transcriptional regulator [Planctomycetota bacterium]|jgi:AraC-like DNA-binding protein|nr:helix-turn-helix transcriptional regulator [Planctomycetota bacterium]
MPQWPHDPASDLTPLVCRIDTDHGGQTPLRLRISRPTHPDLHGAGVHMFSGLPHKNQALAVRWLPDCSVGLLACCGAATRVVVVGARARALMTSLPSCRFIVGAFIHPGFCQSVLGQAGDVLFEQAQALEALWDGPRVTRLVHELSQHQDTDGALMALEQVLAEGLTRETACSLVTDACRLIEADNGQTALPAIAARLGCSERHLRREFRHHTGHSVKGIARCLRLRAVLSAIAELEHEALGWRDLAAEYGFSDQSHLIAEFRQMLGITPSALAAALKLGATIQSGMLITAETNQQTA